MAGCIKQGYRIGSNIDLMDTKDELSFLHVTLRTSPHSRFLLGDVIIPDSAHTLARASIVMDQRVITKWYQPLRSSKNINPPKRQLSIDSFCVAGSSSR